MPELQRQSGGLDINIEDGVPLFIGATYKINGTPQDILGWSATFTLRDISGSDDPLLTLTEADGISVGATTGRVELLIQGIYGHRAMVYDLQITEPAGVPIRLLRGTCQSHPKGD